MSKQCVFCHPELEIEQRIVLSNDHCMFVQLEQAQVKGSQLEGAGVIIPKKHRQTVFDLTCEEWHATYTLLHKVKKYLDQNHNPQGYNLGWNCGEVGGQHIFHAHFHLIPRYEDEPRSLIIIFCDSETILAICQLRFIRSDPLLLKPCLPIS